MEHSLSNAFLIMIVGMFTVLVVLGLLVVIGNLVIRITNQFRSLPESFGRTGERTQSIPAGTLAAIVAAVEVITGGKGKVTKIEKK